MMTESIYNLIPQEEIRPPKKAMYQSQFRSKVKEEKKTNKSPNRTMGPAKVDLHQTSEFLKKRSGEPKLPASEPFKYADDERKRPPVPKANEKPLMGLKSNKDFVKTNAVENIMSVPRKPAANFADTVHGSTHPLEPSGLVPVYTSKKNFGKVPEYLTKRNEEVRRAQEEYDDYIREHYRRGAMKNLSESERQSIIDGLKKNWEGIHHQYQGLSMVTDTAPKKARKERLEAEMKQLERDIELLEKHNVIYISH
ncbi:enkurin-like [Anneissia japonica]|uniref:enkurin-like n=1 Tax=Anneissia japonica TaxID=1529436 RepID=UPI0014257220|nr:enkurin-like [Anneissia japonica]